MGVGSVPLFAPQAAAPSAPNGITLRDYQHDAINAVRTAYLRGVRRQLITMCTGTGKTNTFSMLPASLGLWPVLIMMDRNELVEQNAATFQRLNPNATVTIEKAERIADINADWCPSCASCDEDDEAPPFDDRGRGQWRCRLRGDVT